MTYDQWLAYFLNNPQRHAVFDAAIDWHRPTPMTARQAGALARSLQRFELGEGGDGKRLLAKAEAAGDPVYTAALKLFVAEEQKHSALFLRSLDYLSHPPLRSHWSDRVFVFLRRALGLRLELMLFLVAESIALEYFRALGDGAPDPVIRLVSRRVLTDEKEHVRFQIHRLVDGFQDTPGPLRILIHGLWWVLAAGAAVVVAWDHRGALRACGLTPRRFLPAALREFGRASAAVMSPARNAAYGPSEEAYLLPAPLAP